MRRACVLLSLMLLCSMSVRAQDTNLEETQKWIKEKVLNYAFFSAEDKNLRHTHSCKIEQINFMGCKLHLVEQCIDRSDTPGQTVFTYDSTVDLAALDASKVRVNKSIPFNAYLLNLPTIDRKKNVQQISELRVNSSPPSRKESTDDHILIYFGDRDMSARVARAFSYVIKQCSDKKEPF